MHARPMFELVRLGDGKASKTDLKGLSVSLNGVSGCTGRCRDMGEYMGASGPRTMLYLLYGSSQISPKHGPQSTPKGGNPDYKA